MNAYVTFHAKDAGVLPFCVRALRDCPDVSEVRVIAAARHVALCRRVGAAWVDEDEIVPGVRHDSFAAPRWGWYFQQILKLGVAWMEGDGHYLTVDADTVFLRPVRFVSEQGQACCVPAHEFHPPYFETFERLLGFAPLREFSFIAHHMVFRGDLVREMCAAFEPRGQWWEKIAGCLEPRAPHYSRSQFSEYETYGHYVARFHPGEMIVRPLRWRNVADFPSRRRIERLAREYDFVSFQEYLRTERRLSRPWRVMLSNAKRGVLDRVRRRARS